MSRIGKFPIPLPPKVEVTLGTGEITVKGPLGTLTRSFGDSLSIEKDGNQLVCKAANESANAMHGTLRALHEADDVAQREDLARVATRLWLRPETLAVREAA